MKPGQWVIISANFFQLSIHLEAIKTKQKTTKRTMTMRTMTTTTDNNQFPTFLHRPLEKLKDDGLKTRCLYLLSSVYAIKKKFNFAQFRINGHIAREKVNCHSYDFVGRGVLTKMPIYRKCKMNGKCKNAKWKKPAATYRTYMYICKVHFLQHFLTLYCLKCFVFGDRKQESGLINACI